MSRIVRLSRCQDTLAQVRRGLDLGRRQWQQARSLTQVGDIEAAFVARTRVSLDRARLFRRKRSQDVCAGALGHVVLRSVHELGAPTSRPSKRARNFCKPMRILPLTVPSGTPINVAISDCV